MKRVQAVASRNTPASQLVRRLTRAGRTGVRTITDGPAKGMKLDVADSRPSYVLGTAEPLMQDFIVHHLARSDVFYDLGANVGYFSLVASAVIGPGGSIRAYEPLPANVVALRRTVELNKMVNVTVIDAAVSSEEGTAFFVEGGTGQDGRLGEGGLRVRTVTVDAEIQGGAPPPSMIKLDIEGAEHDALLGMQETLRKFRPIIICEMHVGPWDLETNPVPALPDRSRLRRQLARGRRCRCQRFVLGAAPHRSPALKYSCPLAVTVSAPQAHRSRNGTRPAEHGEQPRTAPFEATYGSRRLPDGGAADRSTPSLQSGSYRSQIAHVSRRAPNRRPNRSRRTRSPPSKRAKRPTQLRIPEMSGNGPGRPARALDHRPVPDPRAD